VAAAIRWVRDNIGAHCPEVLCEGESQPRGVFLTGHSAGAHLISLIAADSRYLVAQQVPPEFVRGVCAISGVYTFAPGPLADTSRLLNALFRLSYATAAAGPSAAAWADASPVNHVHGAMPPFLVLSAASDLGLEVDARRCVRACSSDFSD
jgi:acetyl esterase/lipase